MKKIHRSAKSCLLLSLCVLLMLALVSCQTAPDNAVDTPVNGNGTTEQKRENTPNDIPDTSTDNSSIEQNEVNESDISAQADLDNAEIRLVQNIEYSTIFQNEAGNATINIDNINVEYPNESLPIIQVTPYCFTAEDAKRVAETLFGEAVLYEKGQELTKAEIEKFISMYEDSLTDEALYADYGPDEDNIEIGRQGRQDLLDYYRGLYGDAPEETVRQLCQWTFYPMSHYIPGPDITTESENKTVEINAIAECSDGRVYSYQVLNRDADDRSEHRINVYLDSPLDSGMLREPTAEDMENARLKAEALLSETGLGQFTIDKICSVQYSEDGAAGYVISVSGVPMLDNYPVLHQRRVSATSFAGSSSYSPEYNPQRVSFHFTADGMLLDFKYESPLTTVNAVNAETSIISWEEVRELIEQCLRSGEEPFTTVTIYVNEIALGLARIDAEDDPAGFQLVPALTLRGHREVYNDDGSFAYSIGKQKDKWSSAYDEGYETDLLTINLVDGSVIVENQVNLRDIDIW